MTWILFSHYLADFVLYPSKWGANKHKEWGALNKHVALYMLLMFMFLFPLYGFKTILYVLFNGFLHWIIDSLTSRASNFFYKKQEIKLFWCVIGFDQFLHVALLFNTFYWLN